MLNVSLIGVQVPEVGFGKLNAKSSVVFQLTHTYRASSYVFQNAITSDVGHTDLQIANTTVTSYIGIDKRMGLTNVAKRLTESRLFSFCQI